MAKISICEASARLKMHPSNFLILASKLVGTIEDCWPEIEEGLVETIISLKRPRYVGNNEKENVHVDQPKTTIEKKLPISEEASIVLEKLFRKKFFGTNSVSLRTIKINLCRNVQNVENAIEELVKSGYLEHQPRRDVYSLMPAKTHEIEEIAQAVREKTKLGEE